VLSKEWTDDVTLCTDQRFRYGDNGGLWGAMNDMKRFVARIWAWHNNLAYRVTKKKMHIVRQEYFATLVQLRKIDDTAIVFQN
jgi:hypothetical protein